VTTSANVLIVEDDPEVAHLLSTSLALAGLLPRHVSTAAAGLEAVRRDPPDLVVLDLSLPDGSGLDLCRALRADADTRAVRVVILSALGAETDRVAGLQAGADDYVVKPFSVRELVLRVGAVLRRRPAVAPKAESLTLGRLTLMPSARRVFVDGAEATLTYLEFELLVVLATRAGRVQERGALVAHAWAQPPPESGRALDMHITRMRRKLGPCGEYVRSVRGVGYRFSVEPDR
jgi:two-component system phosphate regulon response regulator PhoB